VSNVKAASLLTDGNHRRDAQVQVDAGYLAHLAANLLDDLQGMRAALALNRPDEHESGVGTAESAHAGDEVGPRTDSS